MVNSQVNRAVADGVKTVCIILLWVQGVSLRGSAYLNMKYLLIVGYYLHPTKATLVTRVLPVFLPINNPANTTRCTLRLRPRHCYPVNNTHNSLTQSRPKTRPRRRPPTSLQLLRRPRPRLTLIRINLTATAANRPTTIIPYRTATTNLHIYRPLELPTTTTHRRPASTHHHLLPLRATTTRNPATAERHHPPSVDRNSSSRLHNRLLRWRRPHPVPIRRPNCRTAATHRMATKATRRTVRSQANGNVKSNLPRGTEATAVTKLK